MNPNENSDSKLISQIDRRIQNDQPSGIPLVDDLTAAIPQPRAAFQQQLEDRLAAHYHLPQNGRGELEMVTHTTILNNRPPQKWAFIPLTLAAAMFAVIIVGSIILSPNGGSQGGLGIVLQATASPIPVVNVVIALQNLPLGYQFPSTIDKLTGVVGYFAWPETSIAPGMLREDENGLERLLGQELRADVFREQALISNLFLGGLGENVPIVRSFLPGDMSGVRTVNIVAALQNLPRGYQFPSAIDELAAVVSYIPWPEYALPLNALTEAANGMEKLLGKVLRTDLFREQPILANLVADDLSQIAAVNTAPVQINLPNGKVAVSIPVNPAEIALYGFEEGEQVDLIASLLYINVDNTFQQIPPIATMVLTEPSTGRICISGQPCLETQTIIHQASIAHLGDFTNNPNSPIDILTLAVSPEEATTLIWLMDAKIPYILRPTEINNSSVVANLSPVLVASHDIPWGTHIDIENVVNDVAVVYWQSDIIPEDALTDPAALLDKHIIYHIEQWQPITTADLADQSPYPSNYQPGLLPMGMSAAEIPRNLITNDVFALEPGNRVDISIAFLATNVDSELSNTITPPNGWIQTKLLFKGVEIIKMGRMRNFDGDDQAISIILAIEDGSLLSRILSSQKPISISVSRSDENVLTQETLPDGRLSVTLPVTGVTAADNAQWQSGTGANRVDVIANMTFHTSTADPAQSLSEGQRVSYLVLEDVEFITSMGGDGAPSDPNAESGMTATIAVEPDDLNKLYSAVNAGIPLTIQLRAE